MKCRNVYITLYGKLNDVDELDIVENKFFSDLVKLTRASTFISANNAVSKRAHFHTLPRPPSQMVTIFTVVHFSHCVGSVSFTSRKLLLSH